MYLLRLGGGAKGAGGWGGGKAVVRWGGWKVVGAAAVGWGGVTKGRVWRKNFAPAPPFARTLKNCNALSRLKPTNPCDARR